MKRWMWTGVVLALGAVGCQKDAASPAVARAELKSVGSATMEIIPREGQYPYCLLYTVSEKGIIRQLTMTRENRSIKCEAGKRIYNASFRVPVEEGKIRAYVIFSDQRIQAGPVAQQLYDLRDKERVSAMDLRLPGSVTVQTLEFTPQPGGEPVKDAVVGTTDVSEGSAPEAADSDTETPTPQLGAQDGGVKDGG